MFTNASCKEQHKWFCETRELIINVLEDEGAKDWVEASRILVSTLNEVLIPTGQQAVVTLRPLVACRESDNKI